MILNAVNLGSSREIIQTIHESISLSLGPLDSKTVAIVRNALDKLSQEELTTPRVRIELASLACRIDSLPQNQDVVTDKPLYQRIFAVVLNFFGNENDLLAGKCCEKAEVRFKTAKEIEKVLSKCSEERESILSAAELKQALEASLIKDQFIDLSGIENLADRYLDAFENTRIPFALESYMTGIRTLDNPRVTKTLERFVRSVLLGTFEAERYGTDKNSHLKRIQKYDEETNSNILDKWQRLAFEAPIVPVEGFQKETVFSFESFFKEKLGDGHGYKDEVEQLPLLASFLQVDIERQKEILAKLKEEIAAKQQDPSLQLNQAQRLCMELIIETPLAKEEQITKVKRISSLLAHLELVNDLNGLAESLKPSQAISSAEKVQLCTGWEDLFLSGSEVAGSCQRVDGNSSLNRCLLAYCLDGKNAMIAVKAKDGKILARSILRLLWNQTDSKPSLFLDRLYPVPCRGERKDAIQTASKACAEKLGLELFTRWNGGLSSTRTVLESLGSSCSYEYADGAEGVIPNGVFTIRSLQEI